MHERIAPRHAGPPIREEANDRDAEINRVQGFRGVGDAWRQFGFLQWPRRLGLERLRAPDPEQRQDRNRKNQNAHATKPYQQAAPYVDRQRQVIEASEDRCAGRRQSRHRFEVRASEPERGQMQQQRQGRERRQYGPRQCDQEKTVARLQFTRKAAALRTPKTIRRPQ